MFAKFLITLLTVITLTYQAFALTDESRADSYSPLQSLNQDRPLFFTENKGQWDEHVLFKADGEGGLTWFIERDGFTVLQTVYEPSVEQESLINPESLIIPSQDGIHSDPFQSTQSAVPSKSHALKFKFQNALSRTAGNFLPEQTTPAAAVSVDASERLSWNNNYFLGNDESKWAPDCGNYQRLVLKDVWDGVDVVWRGAGESLIIPSKDGIQSAQSAKSAVRLIEFDFIIHPNTDPRQIRVECLGLTCDLEATADGGELLLPTSLGVLRQALPEAFQIESDGSLTPVRAEFKVEGSKSFGVVLPEGWDKSKKLVVDPLVYSTYLGGGGHDVAFAITPDGDGVLVAGYTSSNNFPTTEGAIDQSYNDGDVFIGRLNAEGSQLLFSTYLGGQEGDLGYALWSDIEGDLIVAGQSQSNNFPVTNAAYQRNYGGGTYDAFISKLSEDGNELIYSTYLGGNSYDGINSLICNNAGEVSVAGFTTGNFPATDEAYQRNHGGGYDGFIAKLNTAGSALIYCTYLGGNGGDYVRSIASDGDYGVVVAGLTDGNFPTTEGAYERNHSGNADAFIARLNSNGSALIYSTYFGGSENDYIYSLTSYGAQGVVASGYTFSDNLPTTQGAYQRNFGGGFVDAFIVCLNSEGSALNFSTYLGGNGDDRALATCPDGNGGVVLAGFSSGNFPTTEGAYQRNHRGSYDIFIARLNSEGTGLLYSTYMGGNGDDRANAVATDGGEGVVIAGQTNGNFPISEGVFDQSFNGGSYDAFVTRYTLGLPYVRWENISEVGAVRERELIEIDITGESGDPDANLSLTYSSPDLPDHATFEDHGDGSGTFTWQTTYGDAGDYTAHFVLSDGEHEISADVPIEVKELFHIPLRRGWNMISSAVPPANPAHPAVWADIVGRGNLYIVKDRAGFFYFPPQNFNRLAPWDVRYGFSAKLNEADTLVIPGDFVPEDSVIPLREVWTMIAYYPRVEVDARTAFVNIEGSLEMAKDINGRFYRPANGFSNMGNLKRGQGYQVRISQPCDLVWNLGEERIAGILPAEESRQDGGVTHFQPLEMTGANMSVLISLPTACGGDEGGVSEIAAFTESGLCVGSTGVSAGQTATEGGATQTGFAVWADDPTTPKIDGAVEGETLTFKLWDGMAETPVSPIWDGEDRHSCLSFSTDGFAEATLDVGAQGLAPLPSEFALAEPYPNPFNSITTIRYSLPEASDIKLSVYDLSGREITTMVSGNRLAGVHNAAWNAVGVGSGLYFVKLEAGTKTLTQKVMLVK